MLHAPTSAMKNLLKPLALALALASAQPVLAADWTTVGSDRGKKIEIDRASILRAESGKKVAWGRLVLPEADVAKVGYAMVQALNRYDCQSLKFATIKRVYLNADQRILREERAASDREIALMPGTLDEKLFREVCQPPAAQELAQIADQASRAAVQAQRDGLDQGSIQRTEMVSIKPDLRAAAAESRAQMNSGAKAPEKAADKVAEKPVETVGDAHTNAPPKAMGTEKLAERLGVSPPVRPTPEAHRQPSRRAVRGTDVPLPTISAAERAAARQQLMLTHGAPGAVARAQSPEAKSLGDPHVNHEIHWSYEGEFGPASWGRLKPEWAACSSGNRQSPIDIRDGIKVDLSEVKFDYKPSYFSIVDNGHTVQVNVGEGSSITVGGRSYELLQFHFHKPSEERVNGKLFDMVAHLVHRDADGRLAVVGVLLEKGLEHPVLQTLWANLPLEQKVEVTAEASIDLNKLLPEQRNYYTYMGSLTTPPCSEGVLWMIMKQPVQISPEQLAIFGRLYKNNARPVQAANARLIKESR